jgi:hypothetical protein
MIKETKRKIHFITYIPTKGRPKDESKPPYASVSKKYGVLKFGKKAINALEMDKKFIKLFYEPVKKIIGWQITNHLNEGQLKSKEWRPITPNKINGTAVISIKPIIDMFNGSLTEDSYKCEIFKYREQSDILSRGDVTYFVKVGKAYDENEE